MSGADPDSYAALYRLRFTRRLPGELAELTGPVHGVVDLPLHVVWQGSAASTWTGHASA